MEPVMPEKNKLPPVGAYVTWGSEYSAHKVIEVNEEGGTFTASRDCIYLMSDPSRELIGGEGTYTVRVSSYAWRVVPHPEDTLSDEADFDVNDLFDEAEEDIVTKPSHYARWAIEPITFIMRNGFEFWRGNIVKYASRAGHKMYPDMDETQSEITDLKKVIRYAEMRINQLEGNTEL